jgi:asparagine synthetase B (glutamine-hydrolysing)
MASDMPVSLLLSGGLDSSITSSVAFSGEGADEFFEGYVHPLRQFQEFLKGNWL